MHQPRSLPPALAARIRAIVDQGSVVIPFISRPATGAQAPSVYAAVVTPEKTHALPIFLTVEEAEEQITPAPPSTLRAAEYDLDMVRTVLAPSLDEVGLEVIVHTPEGQLVLMRADELVRLIDAIVPGAVALRA